MTITAKRKTFSLPLLYLLVFLGSLHYALPVYINSTFITEKTSESFVGIIYTIASLLAIIAIILTPLLLKRAGNYRVFLSFAFLQIISLLGLVFFKEAYIIIPIFILNQILISLMIINTDIFLESYDDNRNTGKIRGIALTVSNFAFLISPLVIGFLLTDGDFWKIYLLAAIVTGMMFLLTQFYFKGFKDPIYQKASFMATLWKILKNKDLRSIFVSNFILRLFYAGMVIYTPIFLYEYIGFDWSTIGIIFFIMILPFVILELPLGRIADKLIGEKELLTVGFVVTAIFTLSLSLTSSINPAWWAFLLFGTRIGASIIEIMSETHFFKLVDGKDANIISFFRNNRPLAYVIAPLIASFSLLFIELRYIFIVFAVIIFIGIFFSLSIKDTR